MARRRVPVKGELRLLDRGRDEAERIGLLDRATGSESELPDDRRNYLQVAGMRA
jgi:hypothetical protein